MDELLASDIVDDPRRSAAAEPERAIATAKRRRRWGRHATHAAVALAAIGGFFAIAHAMTGRRGSVLDHGVVRAIGKSRRPSITLIARGVTSFGSVAGGFVVALSAMAAARRRPRSAAQIAVGALGGLVAELGIKRFYARKRPTLLEHLEQVKSTSFPSGHAMASASLYLTLALVASRSRRLRAHRAAIVAGASCIAGAIGTTRVYLGVHWPTDVLGGLALGTAWACAVEAAFDFTGAERAERDVAIAAALPTTVRRTA